MDEEFIIRETLIPFKSKFTVLDFETSNKLADVNRDSKKLSVSILGVLNDNKILQVLRIKNKDESSFKTKCKEVINSINKEIYSFNKDMELGCLEGYFNHQREIKEIAPFCGKGVSKYNLHLFLKNKNNFIDSFIEKNNDPFNGNSLKCIEEWSKENYEECLNHNMFCLLSELNIIYYKDFLLNFFKDYLDSINSSGLIWLRNKNNFLDILKEFKININNQI